jgi:GDP-4-dehydro-6-deoxy-D-mannose reductase
VTGAEGFAGGYLVAALERRAESLIPVRKPHDSPLAAGWYEVDLRVDGEVDALLRDARPTRIVHLAAIAYPPDATVDPREAVRVNYGAVDALLRAIAEHAPTARLLYVGSGAAYGGRPADAPPFREEDPLEPLSPYAATKAAAEQRVALAADAGLDVVRARPFNHSGPGRPASYAESSFARQIADIERSGANGTVRVGNLDAIRDLSDVRDVVDAYALLLDRGESGAVYNVCSGRGRPIRTVLDYLVSLATCHVQVEVDPERHRPLAAERLALVGSPRRLEELGWRPSFTFEQTLKDLLQGWRSEA